MNFRVQVIIVITVLSLLASARLWYAGYQLNHIQTQATQQQQNLMAENVSRQLNQLIQNTRLLTQNAAKSARWKDALTNGTQPILARDFAQQASGFGVNLVMMHDKLSGNVFLSDAPTRPGESWGQAEFFQQQYLSPDTQPRVTVVREKNVLLFAEPVWLDNEVKAIVALGLPLDEALLNLLKDHSGVDLMWSTEPSRIKAKWPNSVTNAPELALVMDSANTTATTTYSLGALFFLVLGAAGIYWLLRTQQQLEAEKLAFLNAVELACEAGDAKALHAWKTTPSAYAVSAEHIDHLRSKHQNQLQQLQAQTQRLQQQNDELLAQNKTLQRERDAAVNLPKTKSEFLSRMGEEITTPMNSMMGMLELLEKYPMSAEPKELLTISVRAGRTLKDNLTNILDFSRMDAGLHKLQRREVSVRHVVQKTLGEFQHYVDGRNLKLTSSVNVDVPEKILSDDARIAQVLGNLIGNAVRFTKEGEIGVYVDVLEQNNRKRIRFSVSDTGQGIPKEAISGLFDSLDSRSKLTNASFAGRLRLIVSKQLSELMGGEIGVSSEVGKGSRFWFTVAYENS